VSQPQLPPRPAEPTPATGVESGGPRATRPDEQAMLFCPVCSVRLASRKCKLFCEQCGYYMSCADYI